MAAVLGLVVPAGVSAKMSAAGNVVAISHDSSVTTEELQNLAKQGNDKSHRIAIILGRTDDEKIRVIVREDVEVTYASHYRRTIVTGVAHLKNAQVPLAHELTHILTGRAATHVLSEGFAVYMQERTGTGRVFPNYGRDVDARLRENAIKWNIPVPPDAYGFAVDHIGDMEQMRKRIMSYLFAGSFCRFVIETVLGGDVPKFMKIFWGCPR